MKTAIDNGYRASRSGDLFIGAEMRAARALARCAQYHCRYGKVKQAHAFAGNNADTKWRHDNPGAV